MLALHNGDGRLLWSLDFGPAAGMAKLALWRVPHDVTHDLQVRRPAGVVACCDGQPSACCLRLWAVLCSSLFRMCSLLLMSWYKVPPHGYSLVSLPFAPLPPLYPLQVVAFAVGAGAGSAIVINAHAGTVLQTLPLLAAAGAAAAPDILHLPQTLHDGLADQHVYVVAPAGASKTAAAVAQVLPDTPQARAAFAAASPTFGFWRVDDAAGAVRGLGFDGSGGVEERWAASLAPAGGGQRIVAVAAHAPDEAVYTPARVLGNGELKFKYLNPSVVLVAVAGEGAGAGGEQHSRLTVTLLDAVSGRLLHSQTHKVGGWADPDPKGGPSE